MKKCLSLMLSCIIFCSLIVACGANLSKEEKLIIGDWDLIDVDYEYRLSFKDDYTMIEYNEDGGGKIGEAKWKYEETYDEGVYVFVIYDHIYYPDNKVKDETLVLAENEEIGPVLITVDSSSPSYFLKSK